jgi:hypothetical protein
LFANTAYFAVPDIQTGRTWLISKVLSHHAKAMQKNVMLQINNDISDETVPVSAILH